MEIVKEHFRAQETNLLKKKMMTIPDVMNAERQRNPPKLITEAHRSDIAS